MKRDHPLLQALTTKKSQSFTNRLHVHPADAHALRDKRPGDSVHVNVHGTVKSMHDDGRMSIEVHHVTPHVNDEPPRQEQKPVWVKTDTSPAP